MSLPRLTIDAGAETEDLLQFVTRELDDATLDGIDIERVAVPSDKLATEPLTAAATLALATTAVITVARLIERWMEMHRQTAHLKIVAQGFAQSDEAGKALAKIAESHAKVALSFGAPKK
ncbi:MAG: hypothetical protein QM777_18720 [Pseudorhodoferax sp.]